MTSEMGRNIGLLALVLSLAAICGCHGNPGESVQSLPTTVTGRVQLEDAVDHEGIEVYLPGTTWIAKTNRNGGFTFGNIPSGTYELVAEFEGYQSYRSDVFSVSPNQVLHLEPILLTVDESRLLGTITGIVRLENAADNSGAIVSLEGTAFTFSTGNEGAFRFEEVPPGEYIVSAQKAGFRSSETIRVNLEPLGSLDIGEVILQRNALPTMIPSATDTLKSRVEGRVYLIGSTSYAGTLVSIAEPYQAVECDATGYFMFPAVPVGRREVTYSRRGFDPLTVSAEIREGSPTILRPVLLHEALPAGRERFPVEGYVEVERAEDRGGVRIELIAASPDVSPQETLTSRSGRYTFKEVPDGTYRIRATKEGYQDQNYLGVDVRNGTAPEPPVLYLALDENALASDGGVQGTAYLEDAQDHGGILVGLEGTSVIGQTAADGVYRLANVTEGVYTLRATKEGYEPGILDGVTVPPGGRAILPVLTLKKVRDYVKVVSTSPSNGAKDVVLTNLIPVTIRFDRPMVGPTVKNSIRILPSVTYNSFFGNEHPAADLDTLHLELVRSERPPVKFKTTYTIEVRPGASDHKGNTLKEPYRFSFTTAGARVIGSFPRDGANRIIFTTKDSISIDFNTQMDPETLFNAFRVSPSPASDPELYTSRTPFGYRASFSLELNENTTYTVRLSDRAKTVYGERLENTPYSFRFSTGSVADLPSLGEEVPPRSR